MIIPSFGLWLISCWRIVDQEESALAKFFGHVERRRWMKIRKPRNSSDGLFGGGLHFVLRFPGIILVRTSKEMYQFAYEGDPNKPSWEISGTQIPARTKDYQKVRIDLTAFLRVPHEDIDQLILMIESKVPVGDKNELRIWFERGFRDNLGTAVSKYGYKEVAGARRNQELSDNVDELLQLVTGPLVRSGLFDKDKDSYNIEGEGEAYLKIQYVHVQGPLGRRLEEVATTQLQVEIAESTAEIKNRELNRPIELGLAEWVMGEVKRQGLELPGEWLRREVLAAGVDVTIAADVAKEEKRLMGTDSYKKIVADVVAVAKTLMASPAYTKKQQALHELRSRELAGGGTYEKEEVIIDVNSAGQQIHPDMAAIMGMFGGIGAIFAAAKSKGGGGGGNGGNRKKKKGGKGKSNNSDDEDDDDEDFDKMFPKGT